MKEKIKIIPVGSLHGDSLYQDNRLEQRVVKTLVEIVRDFAIEDKIYISQYGKKLWPVVLLLERYIGSGGAGRTLRYEHNFYLLKQEDCDLPENLLEALVGRNKFIEIIENFYEAQYLPAEYDEDIAYSYLNFIYFWQYRGDCIFVDNLPKFPSHYEFIKDKVKEHFYENDKRYVELKNKIKRIEGLITGQLKRRNFLTDDVIVTVFERDGGKCGECGSINNLQLDHIIPFSRGGSDDEENLRLLCQSCNARRGNMSRK